MVDSRVHPQSGFVLPYVLVAIAILSMASIIAIQRTENTSRLITAIQEETNAQWALMSAEAETIFTVLTAIPVEGGLDLKAERDISDLFGSPSKGARESPDAEFWSAAGGVRRSDTAYGPVIVHYRDAAGLVALNNADLALLEKLITSLGVQPEAAKTMAATLVDYRDEDNRRQFRGAERASYRLHNKLPPTNSPLRSYGELEAVLKWSQPLQTLDMQRLKEQATLSPTLFVVKKSFAAPDLVRALELDRGVSLDDIARDDIEAIFANDTYPSGVMRFSFTYQGSDGRLTQRALEIERKVNALSKPFGKFCIYERVVLDDPSKFDLGPVSELKNVVFSPSYRAE